MSYPVKNSDIEGQHILFQVTPVQLSKLRLLLAVVFSICSAFIFALALRYSRKFYNAFLFTQCQEESVATHYQIETVSGEQFVCAKKFIDNKPYFMFRMLKYRFNEQIKSYEPIEFDAKDKVISEFMQSRNALSRDLKIQYFGTCQLKIPIESIFIYSLHAFTGPFNILQYFAVAIWFAEKTVLQPVLILIFTVLTVYLNYFLYIRSRRRLQQLANIHQEVTIKEGDQLKLINGADLAPGDLLILKDNQTLNCDCAIISGDVIVNEATLTGEGIPIPKSALPNQNSIFELEKMSQHCLFEGTKLIQVNNAQENIAIVLRTGFTSLRGQYFRNVLTIHFYIYIFYILLLSFFIKDLVKIFQPSIFNLTNFNVFKVINGQIASKKMFLFTLSFVIEFLQQQMRRKDENNIICINKMSIIHVPPPRFKSVKQVLLLWFSLLLLNSPIFFKQRIRFSSCKKNQRRGMK